jgi:hypothetical protein
MANRIGHYIFGSPPPHDSPPHCPMCELIDSGMGCGQGDHCEGCPNGQASQHSFEISPARRYSTTPSSPSPSWTAEYRRQNCDGCENPNPVSYSPTPAEKTPRLDSPFSSSPSGSPTTGPGDLCPECGNTEIITGSSRCGDNNQCTGPNFCPHCPNRRLEGSWTCGANNMCDNLDGQIDYDILSDPPPFVTRHGLPYP